MKALAGIGRILRIAFVVIAGAAVLGLLTITLPAKIFQSRVAQIETVADAKSVLGEPRAVMRPGDESQYLDLGYPCAGRTIVDHALVFGPFDIDALVFLYFDQEARVEGYEICGT